MPLGRSVREVLAERSRTVQEGRAHRHIALNGSRTTSPVSRVAAGEDPRAPRDRPAPQRFVRTLTRVFVRCGIWFYCSLWEPPITVRCDPWSSGRRSDSRIGRWTSPLERPVMQRWSASRRLGAAVGGVLTNGGASWTRGSTTREMGVRTTAQSDRMRSASFSE